MTTMGLPMAERASLDKQDLSAQVEEAMLDAAPTPLTKGQDRKMRLKIDFRVITMMSILLAISIIDRINIGNAKVLGMDQDLGINKGSRYSVCLLVFFPGYFLSEVPSNMMLVKFGPRVWMTFLTFGFGLCVMCMGFAPNYHVLAFLRFMLGLFEGGIYPACVFLLSSWFPRYRLHRRLSALYSVGAISSAFGGVLAYGISKMSGTRNMLGWRWVFIVRPVPTHLSPTPKSSGAC
jgi:MFS family permease